VELPDSDLSLCERLQRGPVESLKFLILNNNSIVQKCAFSNSVYSAIVFIHFLGCVLLLF
jgi:hypothetical protein